jgi:hypothetical protein
MRSQLLYQACARIPTLADDPNTDLRLSGRELVHTSYFENQEVLRIIYAHIVVQSRAPGLSLEGIDPRTLAWIREFKLAVAPHFVQHGRKHS